MRWSRRLYLRPVLAVAVAAFGSHSLGCATLAFTRASDLDAPDFAAPDFERQIAPLLIKRCLECHQEKDPAGGLSLVSGEALMSGGDSGLAISSGAPEESYLLERVQSGEMPPEQKGISQQLSDEEIALLQQWVQAGATWPEQRTLDLYEITSDVRGGRDWWSLQRIERVEPPEVKQVDLVSNSIDAFILARLQLAGLEPAPLESKRKLIRRVYYDVIGLPPTYEEVAAFEADESANAWQRVVDRLLESPQYGERWARYWLDLVRFAETSGYERDQEKPFAWRYRDWVVDALNSDMPYDRFVLEQLAGDELPDRSERSVVATGMLRLGTWNDEPNDPDDYKYERLEDLVHVTSTAFLSLTVKCARCHDHKFDPIPQTDYYQLAAVFWPGAIEPRDRKWLGGPTEEELGFENVLGWTDLGATAEPLHLLKLGERSRPGEVIAAGALSSVRSLARPFEPPPADATTTTRRLQLARWIVDSQNPLTSRVLVNRLWQHHFGAGLVRTPNNFGFNGDQPTHPALLDWLADELIQGEWRMKRMHKLMLMSRTFRQSSIHPRFDQYNERDAANRHWWRAERRRLDAEALRDTMLYVAGELDETQGGPSFHASVSPNALQGLSRKDAAWEASPQAQQRRRSLYMFAQRSLLSPMMTTFDFCDTVAPCGKRDVTTAATQALALLNSTFSHDRSRALAKRVVDLAADDPQQQVRLVWRFALGRLPTAFEEQLAQAHLAEGRQRFRPAATTERTTGLISLESLCHVLLNSNEFVYLD